MLQNEIFLFFIFVFCKENLYNFDIGSECPVYTIKYESRPNNYPDRFVKITQIGAEN
jgi:hypothetical protein